MNKSKFIAGAAPLQLACLVVLASPAVGQGTVDLPSIDVPGATAGAPDVFIASGEGTDTTSAVEQADRPDTVTIVDQEEIQEINSVVAYDVLETKPGLSVVRRLGNTGSGLSRLSIRGNGSVGPAGLQVYVDGRPDATVSFAHPTPSALGLNEAEYIEVIHGPSPVLNGSGKTGVLNIVTAVPEPGLHALLETSYGDFDTNDNYGRVSYAGDKGYARVAYSHNRTNGSNPESDATVKNLNFKGQYIINDVLDVTFTYAENKDEYEVFREFFVPGPFTDPRTEDLNLNQTVYDVTVNADFGNVATSLKYFHDELDPQSQFVDAGEERAEVEEEGLRFKTVWDVSDRTKIISGIDHLKARAENSPVLPPFILPLLGRPRQRILETLDETSYYGYADHELTNTLTLSGGYRYTDHSAYGDVDSGEVGILFAPEFQSVNHPLHGTTYRARATHGYQSPTLQQLYGIFRGGRAGPANPNLGPEKIDQYEIGFNKAFRRGNFDLVLYKQQAGRLIEFPLRVPPPPPPPPRPPEIKNVDNYSTYGLEAVFHYSLTKNLDAMVGLSIADFDQQTNRFLRVPEKTLDAGFTYRRTIFRHNDLTVSLIGRYAQDIFDVPVVPINSPRVPLDDYFVADLKVNFDVTDNATLWVAVDNITDERYELVTGIPAAPLGVFTGLRVKM